MGNIFFIDYENVGPSGIEILYDIGKGDYVFIFYSDECKTVPFEAVSYISRKNAKYKSICVENGTKDALDFQLSSVLGYMISVKKRAAKYYIVSNDKGFDCLCYFWRKSKFKVHRVQVIGTKGLISKSKPS